MRAGDVGALWAGFTEWLYSHAEWFAWFIDWFGSEHFAIFINTVGSTPVLFTLSLVVALVLSVFAAREASRLYRNYHFRVSDSDATSSPDDLETQGDLVKSALDWADVMERSLSNKTKLQKLTAVRVVLVRGLRAAERMEELAPAEPDRALVVGLLQLRLLAHAQREGDIDDELKRFAEVQAAVERVRLKGGSEASELEAMLLAEEPSSGVVYVRAKESLKNTPESVELAEQVLAAAKEWLDDLNRTRRFRPKHRREEEREEVLQQLVDGPLTVVGAQPQEIRGWLVLIDGCFEACDRCLMALQKGPLATYLTIAEGAVAEALIRHPGASDLIDRQTELARRKRTLRVRAPAQKLEGKAA